MPWRMTRAEKHYDKLATGQFKNKYCRRKNHKTFVFSKKRLRRWRIAVLTRDNYTCCDCGLTESLHVHHIKWQIDNPELSYKVKNGVTLCRECHNRRHDGLLDYYSQQKFLREIVSQDE